MAEKNVAACIEELGRNAASTREEIVAHFVSLREQLAPRERDLLSTVNKIQADRVTAFQEQRMEQAAVITHVVAAIDESARCMQRDDFGLLQAYRSVNHRVVATTEELCRMNPAVSTVIPFAACTDTSRIILRYMLRLNHIPYLD